MSLPIVAGPERAVWGNQGLREGGTRGTLYPRPVGSGAREDGSTHAKIFCNQAQIGGCFIHLQRW